MTYSLKRALLTVLGIILVFIIGFFFILISDTSNNIADDNADINFFYSQTCPHCHEEQKFLSELQIKYPELKINKHDIAEKATTNLLKKFGEKYDVKEYLGVVPLTFVGDSFVIGFNTAETTGITITELVDKKIAEPIKQNEICEDTKEACVVSSETTENVDKNYTTINQLSNLSLFGINAKDLSLPVLAVTLGFFDGFNVCSLGALLLILSLVFVFKSRKKTFLFGAIFLVITGVTYAALIFLWFGLFSFFSSFVTVLQVIIGAMGIIGGIYFIRQYIRFLKYGPMCEMTESEWIKKVTKKLQNAFNENKNIWIIGLAVILFSFAVTIIEFPCSAVIPVAFAAILTEAGIGLWAKISYLIVYMALYLIDEIVVFLIGVFAMKIWVGGQKITKHLALVQAIVFIGLGVFYLTQLLN